MCGEVCFARLGQGIEKPIGLHCLKRIADAGWGMAIVDDQGGATGLSDVSGYVVGHRLRGGGYLENCTLSGTAQMDRNDRVRHRIGRGGEDQIAAIRAHHTLAPAALLPNELMNRKRVEILIGDEEKRCVV